jgi:hypothetical protein
VAESEFSKLRPATSSTDIVGGPTDAPSIAKGVNDRHDFTSYLPLRVYSDAELGPPVELPTPPPSASPTEAQLRQRLPARGVQGAGGHRAVTPGHRIGG